MRFETLAIHAGGEPDAETGAIAPPIHMSTTFRHGPAGERVAGYEYVREGNPTQDRLETAVAALEQGQAALAFGSGMAAMTALLEYLPAGSRLLYPRDCYMGLRVLLSEFLPQRGVQTEAVDMREPAALAARSKRRPRSANAGVGPSHRSDSTSVKSGRSVRRRASSRNRKASRRCAARVAASTDGRAAFTPQTRQSSGMSSRWPNRASTAAAERAPQPGRPG